MKKLNADIFKERSRLVHGDKYDYSLVTYSTNREKVKIICPTHGIFYQYPYAHFIGKGCPICGHIKKGKTKTFTTKVFIEKAQCVHNYLYDYSDVVYVKKNIKVNIICKKHGVFKQTPNRHLQGDGCPRCRSSRGERRIEAFLTKHKIYFEREAKFGFCKIKRQLPYDFYLPDYNVLIEYQGIVHFKPWKLTGDMAALLKKQANDKFKKEKAVENGYVFKEYLYSDSWDYIFNDILNTLKLCQ